MPDAGQLVVGRAQLATWPPRDLMVTAPRRFPPAGLPSHAQLTYTKELITVFLLVLALPWLVSKLLTQPSDVLAGLGRRQVQKAT